MDPIDPIYYICTTHHNHQFRPKPPLHTQKPSWAKFQLGQDVAEDILIPTIYTLAPTNMTDFCFPWISFYLEA